MLVTPRGDSYCFKQIQIQGLGDRPNWLEIVHFNSSGMRVERLDIAGEYVDRAVSGIAEDRAMIAEVLLKGRGSWDILLDYHKEGMEGSSKIGGMKGERPLDHPDSNIIEISHGIDPLKEARRMLEDLKNATPEDQPARTAV